MIGKPEYTMTLCMVYNTTGEPVELVSTLMGLRLHLLGKAVVLETIPDRVARSARPVFPLRMAPWVPTRGHLMTRRLAAYGTAA